MPVSFATDIRPLFRDIPDVDSMQGYGLDLSSYEEVRARASEIYARPADGSATCRWYTDFLIRCAYTEPYPVPLAMLFGVEASYLAAWSTLLPSGPYAEFIQRWSSADFAAYVGLLGALADRNPHEAAQEHFNEVLVHEREFWKMSWEG
jgi:thiaminase